MTIFDFSFYIPHFCMHSAHTSHNTHLLYTHTYIPGYLKHITRTSLYRWNQLKWMSDCIYFYPASESIILVSCYFPIEYEAASLVSLKKISISKLQFFIFFTRKKHMAFSEIRICKNMRSHAKTNNLDTRFVWWWCTIWILITKW